MTFIPRHMSNRIWDAKPTIADGVTYPWTLDEVKAWLNVTYTDDDTLLEALIKQVADGVEQFCNISIIEKSYVLNADLYESIELPYGPVRAVAEVKIKSGKNSTTGVNEYDTLALTDYNLDGDDFIMFCPSQGGRYRISYTTGITDADLTSFGQSLKLDGLRIIGYCYEHRGDEPLSSLESGIGRPRSLDEALELFASKYKRMCWI